MPESTVFIPEELILARIVQSEQMREFFMQMWLQNPALAKQAGARVREIINLPAVPPAPTFEGR
jgi:hypothetical protein